MADASHDALIESLRRAFEGPAWAGTALMEALAGIDTGEAAARPVAAAHSIGELAVHAGVWKEAVRRRLGGEWWTPDPGEDWPTVGPWPQALERLRDRHQALERAVRDFDPVRLGEEPRPGAGYSWRVMILGMAEHDLYHAGQIVLLRRALGR